MSSRSLAIALTFALAAAPAALQADTITVDFDDLGLGADSYENGANLAGRVPLGRGLFP